mgnify:CR=1 FL=1
MLRIDDIETLFLTKGHEQYSGEPVTQLQHALQSAALAEAEATLAEAAANAERAAGLQDTGALSASQIQQYATAALTARARVAAQRAAVQSQQLRLKQTQVLAPDDGIVSARSATVGAVVGSGQELFRLIRGGRLEWRAELPSADLARVRVPTLVLCGRQDPVTPLADHEAMAACVPGAT